MDGHGPALYGPLDHLTSGLLPCDRDSGARQYAVVFPDRRESMDRSDGANMAIYVVVAFVFLITCILAILIETI